MHPNLKSSEVSFQNKQASSKQHTTEAQQFALGILADPILKELYTKMAGKRCSAYSLAMAEYLLMKGNGQWLF